MLLKLLNLELSLAIALCQRAMAKDLLSCGADIPDESSQPFNFGSGWVGILPAGIVQPASRAARLWCVVRSLNHPENSGTGSGLVEISITELCQWLNRSERSVWRYLKDAVAKGYLHNYHCEYGQLRIEYRGLKSLCKHLGLSHMGAIGVFPLNQIEHAKAHATSIQAEKLQAQSFYQMKEWFGRFARGAKTAAELLEKSSSSAKVPGDVIVSRGNRLLYLAPHWRPFGGSQQGIADRLGVSLRTVQYRLSNTWRKQRGIELIEKAQSAHQVFEECPKEFLKDFMRLEEGATQKYVWLGSRLFERGCNLYHTGIMLRSQRFRQAEYNDENVLQSEVRVPCSMPILQAGNESDFKIFEEPEKVGGKTKRARL